MNERFCILYLVAIYNPTSNVCPHSRSYNFTISTQIMEATKDGGELTKNKHSLIQNAINTDPPPNSVPATSG